MKIKNLLLTVFVVFGLTSATTLFGQVPMANFSVNSTSVCIGQIVSITDMSTNLPTSWSYTMAGGTPSTSTLQNPKVTYSTSGVKTILLKSANGSGTSTVNGTTITVSAQSSPSLNLTPPSVSICPGSTLTTSFVGSGAATYTWSTGATTPTLAIPNPTATTVYTLSGTGSNGCPANPKTSTITITAVTPNANPKYICAPYTTIGIGVSAIGNGPFTYTWSPGGGTLPVKLANAPGIYSVTVTDAISCKTTLTISVLSGILPTVSVSASPTTICNGLSTAITISGTATTFTWSTGATTSSIAPTPSATTNYSVIGAIGGCWATASVNITVLATTQLGGASSNTLLCSGQTASIIVMPICCGPPIVSYSWTTGATTSSIVVTPSVSTTYTLYALNSIGCKSSFVITESVSACTGVNGIALQNDSFILYPNPSSGDFTVTAPDAFENSTIEVYNGLGQLVSRNKIVNSSSKINIANEANGVYHVRVMQDGKQVYRTKVLKN